MLQKVLIKKSWRLWNLMIGEQAHKKDMLKLNTQLESYGKKVG